MSFCARTRTLLLLLALLATAAASPFQNGKYAHAVENVEVDVRARLPSPLLRDRQASGPFPVRGAGGGIYPRLEIRDLKKDADMWNLYLLGLQRMQGVDQSDKLSYYGIAGIHGVPYEPWDGVQATGNADSGYCPHSANIFPTWHRPYLALYEEILHAHVQDAANEFPAGPTRDRYLSKAPSFRIPYWDWAVLREDAPFPSILQQETVEVVTPNGTATISNPVFTYRFHPLNHDELYQWWAPELSVFPETVRYPSDKTANAVSRNSLAAELLADNRPSIQSRLYHVFTMVSNYMDAATDLTTDDSFESIHDTIHNSVGGDSGHMTNVPYSSYDPVFYLHHAMVDRIFAMWQALYPDTWFTPEALVNPTFTIAAGTIIGPDDPLTPFHRTVDGTFWTSDDCRDTTSLGYTYPELAATNSSELIETINRLYGPDAGTVGSKIGMMRRTIPGAPTFNQHRDYLAHIKVSKLGLGSSFFVYIFLGQPASSDPASWSQDPNFVGMDGIFVGTHHDQSSPELMVNAVIPLTAALEARMANGELGNLETPQTRLWLKRKLVWRVRSMGSDGAEVPLDQVPGLEVKVTTSRVDPATSMREFPRRVGYPEDLEDVTKGKIGGWARR